jgi:beta-glucosidase
VYLGLPQSTGEYPRLVGWQKISVDAESSQVATITVSAADSSHPLSYWDVDAHAWQNAAGTYTVYLGNSSDNLVPVDSFEL